MKVLEVWNKKKYNEIIMIFPNKLWFFFLSQCRVVMLRKDHRFLSVSERTSFFQTLPWFYYANNSIFFRITWLIWELLIPWMIAHKKDKISFYFPVCCFPRLLKGLARCNKEADQYESIFRRVFPHKEI